MASSGRTPVKRVDRRPLTAAPEPPLARGGARRARACSSRCVASAGPRARAGATGRAGCVPPRRRQHVTDMALDHSPPRPALFMNKNIFMNMSMNINFFRLFIFRIL